MPNFTAASTPADGIRRPARVVVLPPSAFADTWAAKPLTEVAVGLRLIASSDVQASRTIAAEQAKRWFTDRLDGKITHFESADEAYNDAVMRHCVARAACDVNNIEAPYFAAAEDTVRDALTEEGVRALWDELLVLHALSAVGVARADAKDVDRLARILVDGSAIAALTEGEAVELRTLLGYCLARLVGTGKATEAALDYGDGGYVVQGAE